MRTVVAVLICSAPVAAADWQPVTAELLQAEKPGFGGLTGVAVDRGAGRVFVNVSDRGLFSSADAGKTWERVGKAAFKGRTETPGCLLFDPTGASNRFLLATVYGGPVILGTPDASEWRVMDKASGHVDWAGVDWTDPAAKFVIALKHEAGGLLLVSRDGGTTFTEAGKGYGPGWVFDADTAVVARAKSKDAPGSLVRTTDGGKTFAPAGDYAVTALPRWHAGALYWITDKGLIRSADKGATWQVVADVKKGVYGPVTGKDAKHLFVLTAAGVTESTDGGATWAAPVPLPKGVTTLTWLDYDPAGDVLYTTKMGGELFKLARK